MHCGDTLLIPAPGSCDEIPHLWIILTEADALCAIVCLSTLRHSKDQTVVLRAGEHPVVKHETAVLYMYAETVDADHLQQQIAERKALPLEPCRPDVLALIRDGVFASPFTPRKVESFCRQRR